MKFSIHAAGYAAGVAVFACSQIASASTLILPSLYEPDLIGTGGILDTAFGLSNLQRIGDDIDQYWNVAADEVNVTAVAKYAGYTQNFGFIDNNDEFTSLLYVPSMSGQSNVGQSNAGQSNAVQSNAFSMADSGSPFRFGLDPSGSPLFSSDPQDNVSCFWLLCTSPEDHMVSWLITGGDYAGDYVLAWEDLKYLGDGDYNDLVVRVSGVTTVPVPAAFFLFGSGLLGLAAVSRKHI